MTSHSFAFLFVFYLLTISFTVLGQVKQTTFMSHLGFILPFDPGHTTVRQARKISKQAVLFQILL